MSRSRRRENGVADVIQFVLYQTAGKSDKFQQLFIKSVNSSGL